MTRMFAAMAVVGAVALAALPDSAGAREQRAGVGNVAPIEVSAARRYYRAPYYRGRYARPYYRGRYAAPYYYGRPYPRYYYGGGYPYYAPYYAYGYYPYGYYRPYYRPGAFIGVGPFGIGFGW